MPRNARNAASCTTSSASYELPVSHCARRYASAMCGRKTSSNTARSSLFCTIGTDACCWPDKRSGPSNRSFNTTSLSSVRRKSGRRTERGVVMFGTLRLKGSRSFDDDFSNHVRMQAAEVVELAGAGERKRIRVVSIERLRSKARLLLHHRVRNVVVVDPLHGRPHSHRQFLGREREIVDRDLAAGILLGGVLRRYRAKRQHRPKYGTQQHGNDQGAPWSKPRRCEAELADQNLHVKSSGQPASVLSTIASGLL